MLKITLDIDGMACSMCESHVNDAIRRAFKVKKVTSSHVKKQTVILTEEDISDEKLGEALSSTGYRLKGVEREPYVKKGLFGIFKK